MRIFLSKSSTIITYLSNVYRLIVLFFWIFYSWDEEMAIEFINSITPLALIDSPLARVG